MARWGMSTSLRTPWRPLLASWVCIFAIPLAAIGVILTLKARGKVSFGDFSRDVAAIADLPFYFGLLSQAGLVLWAAAATLGLFSAALLLSQGSRRWGLPAYAGGLSLALLVDDLAMLHEHVMPDILGIPEIAVFAGYVAAGAFMVWHFRRELPSTRLDLFALAMVLFPISMALDLGPDFRLQSAAEDSAKFLGICAWFAFVACVAGQRLGATSRRHRRFLK